MNDDDFNKLAEKLAQNLKTDKDVSAMTRILTKVATSRLLVIEMNLARIMAVRLEMVN